MQDWERKINNARVTMQDALQLHVRELGCLAIGGNLMA